MRFRFIISVYQDGKLDEKIEVIQKFTNTLDLAERLARYQLMSSEFLHDENVQEFRKSGPHINIDCSDISQGFGRNTRLIITGIKAL